MVEAKVRGFSIATKCATVEEVVEKFRDRVDAESILVSTVESRQIGTECSFAILLADKKVALAGTCVVTHVYTDANNPFMRPGMRLAIKRLGPQSKAVFAQLLAKRIAPRRMTQAVPVVTPRRASTTSSRRAQSPGLQVEAPRHMPTLQMPPIQAVATPPLARAPRATPFHLQHAQPARVEERTPGSPIVLPANPFTNLSDASLEGFVDGRLFEAKRATSEAEPLPPPPRQPEAPSEPVPAAQPSYAATKLPDLNIPHANDRVAPPLITRRLRNRLVIAVLLVPLLGAAAVVGFMKLSASPPPTIAVTAPATLAAIESRTTLTASMERAPAPPPSPRQPIHAVLVKTYPIAAKVTVAGRSFGTTPTYIKIPANTPVSVHIERPGFKSVVYPLTSRRATDRVFVRLQRRGTR